MKHISRRLVGPLAEAALILLMLQVLTGCSAFNFLSSNQGNKYQYRYKLSSSLVDSLMIYRDDHIYIQFRIDDAAMKFQIQNISPEPLEIPWSRVSLGINGDFSSVKNSGNLYAEGQPCSPSTVLPPLGHTIELLMPARNIHREGAQWKEKDLLPTVDHGSEAERENLLRLAGTSILLMMPMRFGDTTIDYSFRFSVASVDQIPWENVRQLRRPPPPEGKREMLTSEQLVTAGIVVGFVGIASIFLSQKKTEPSY